MAATAARSRSPAAPAHPERTLGAFGDFGLGRRCVDAWGLPRAGAETAGLPSGKAVASEFSLESISTTASYENLLRTSRSRVLTSRSLRSLDDDVAVLDEGGKEFLGTGPAAAAAGDRQVGSSPVGVRHSPATRRGPHRNALFRVQRVRDFKAVYDLGAIGELDGSTLPAFKLGELKRLPRCYDFSELAGVAEFQSQMRDQDCEEP